jgi:hypothetical protein
MKLITWHAIDDYKTHMKFTRERYSLGLFQIVCAIDVPYDKNGKQFCCAERFA